MADFFHIRRQVWLSAGRWWRNGRGFPKCQASLFNLGNELFGELHQFFLCRYRYGSSPSIHYRPNYHHQQRTWRPRGRIFRWYQPPRSFWILSSVEPSDDYPRRFAPVSRLAEFEVRPFPIILYRQVLIWDITTAFYTRKVKYTAETFTERLSATLEAFPRLQDIHPFRKGLKIARIIISTM